MMEKCFDEGTLQAFLDNELSPDLSQSVARHLVDCDPCAILLAEVEEETAFAFAALEQEFNTLIPTQRLWTKINESIEVQHRKRSVWQTVLGFFSGISFTNPHVIAFGSLLLIVGVVSTLIVMKNDNISTNTVAVNRDSVPSVQSTVQNSSSAITPGDEPTGTAPVNVSNPKTKQAPAFRIEKAVYSEPARKTSEKPFVKPAQPEAVVPQFVDGEENYVNTIARLENTVNKNKDEVLKPSARFSYEKDLAVVNDTITKMREKVRKNPKNEDAKQILFATYQNKIELLNSVTQRSELMASLR
jgi:hypothetical protein